MKNSIARARAKGNGKVFYNAEYVDTWPTCVDCDSKIRFRGVHELYRSCDCPDVIWRCIGVGVNAWERKTLDGVEKK